MIKGMSHATLYVTDYDKALEFYTKKLDFELRSDFDLGGGMRWVTVGSKQQPELNIILYKPLALGLIDGEAADAMRSVLEKGQMGGAVFATDNCQQTYEALRSKGVEFLQAPQEQAYGIEAIFKDGCGNWFSLTQQKR